ncbi:hypothetical protein B0H34DRAFT_697914 [Crassisporium funariophilum]|nr:hypothetical protein B0H34DRAFT_697914 [Crassisporium funariophilum]
MVASLQNKHICRTTLSDTNISNAFPEQSLRTMGSRMLCLGVAPPHSLLQIRPSGSMIYLEQTLEYHFPRFIWDTLHKSPKSCKFP